MIVALVRRSIDEALADGIARAGLLFLVGLAVCGPGLSGAGIAAGSRVVHDLGLAGAAALAGAAGILLGIRQVGVEIRSRRALAVFARPVPLGTWVASRLIGVAIVLGALAAAAGAGVAILSGRLPDLALAGAVAIAWARAVVATAAAMAASALARPALAALAAAVLWGATFLAGYAASILSFPPIAWLVPTFDGPAPLAVVHALGWAAVYAAIATWGVGRSDRG